MGIAVWIQLHWLDLLQSIGIVSGFVFTAVTLRADTKVQRLANLIDFTKQHREIWTHLYSKPELARILETRLDLDKRPITNNEELFVSFIILHLSAFQEALKQRLLISPDGLRQDIRDFFSLPIPNAVWQKLKPLHDKDFVAFVEVSLTNR